MFGLLKEKSLKKDDSNLSLFVLWQSLVVASYRSFFSELSKILKCRIALGSPHKFRELGLQEVKCQEFSQPFRLADEHYPYYILKAWVLHIQTVFFFGLTRSIRHFFLKSSGKNIFLCIAEPYSVTALLAWITAFFFSGKPNYFICYSAQNIYKKHSLGLKCLQWFMFRVSDAILSVGDEQTQVLRRQGYSGPVIPFPLWFDSRMFQQSPDIDGWKLHIGYAGAIVEMKGVLDLLSCCEKNTKDWASMLTLHLAGGGDLQDEITRRCQSLRELGWEVNYDGPIPATLVPSFFAKLDMLVVPSKTVSYWKEQFGRVIIEAQAMGVVVLGSNSGEIPKVIWDKERIFKEGSLEDMTRVIDSFLKKREIFRGQNLRASEALKAQRYSDRILAEKFAKEITKALDML